MVCGLEQEKINDKKHAFMRISSITKKRERMYAVCSKYLDSRLPKQSGVALEMGRGCG